MATHYARPFAAFASLGIGTAVFKRHHIKSLAVVPLLGMNALAQAAMAQSVCHEVLEGGAFRHLARQESSYSSLVYASQLERMSYQEANSDFKANGGVSIAGIRFFADMGEKRYQRSIDDLRGKVDLTKIRGHQAQIAVADGDPTIVTAWQHCIQNQQGMVARMKPIDNNTLELIVEYRPHPNPVPPTVEPGTGITNAAVLRGEEFLKVGSKSIGVANPRLITLRRDAPDAAVYASVNTDRGSATAYLPALPRIECCKIPPDIEIPATNYLRSGSFGIAPTLDNENWVWGNGISNPDSTARPNRAAYSVETQKAGLYKMWVMYASGNSRPVNVKVNGSIWRQAVLGNPTGGFCMEITLAKQCVNGANAMWSDLGAMSLDEGTNEVLIDSGSVFPHIKTIRFSFVQQ
jgi:hypothetical protein